MMPHPFVLEIRYRDGKVQKRSFQTMATMGAAIDTLRPALVQSYCAYVILAEQSFNGQHAH